MYFFNLIVFRLLKLLHNIIKNAVEAVISIPNPYIFVKLSELNNLIEISVVDNGVGIDERKISKIFEPYFTTKDKGTGLGLSIVKKIIEDHNGAIKIHKNKNMAGTTSLISFEIN